VKCVVGETLIENGRMMMRGEKALERKVRRGRKGNKCLAVARVRLRVNGEAAESGGFGEEVKTAGGSRLYRQMVGGPGGDTRLAARRTSSSGCGDT